MPEPASLSSPRYGLTLSASKRGGRVFPFPRRKLRDCTPYVGIRSDSGGREGFNREKSSVMSS